MNEISILDVNDSNVEEHGVYCVKNKKADGYKAKVNWFRQDHNKGIGLKIAVDGQDKQLGFIEFAPAEKAWRPISADNYLFIHCIANYAKKDRQKGIASKLIKACEKEAEMANKAGVCVMTSKGPWIADRSLFEKNGYEICDQKGRFELLCKKIDNNAASPKFNNWEKNLTQYKGWHLLFANQCPWHDKSAVDLYNAALDMGIELKVNEIKTPEEAQAGPSGFGTFALIKDGKLLSDHYISRTRFLNILKKEGK